MRSRSTSSTRSVTAKLLRLALMAILISQFPLLTAVKAAEGVSIHVWPATSIEPCDLHIQVLVDRKPENRWIRVTAESPSYFGSSEAQLDGEHSERLRIIRFRA